MLVQILETRGLPTCLVVVANAIEAKAFALVCQVDLGVTVCEGV